MSIERVCEFSGEGGGFEMRAIKRSHIQILPEHRKAFRGAHAELVFTKVELHQCERFNRTLYSRTLSHHAAVAYYGGDIKAWWDDVVYYDGYFHNVEYFYELRVTDPALQGEVKGVYLNWSYKKGDVIRRLKRLIGKNLVIRDEVKLTKKQIIKQWEAEMAEKARMQIEQDKAA